MTKNNKQRLSADNYFSIVPQWLIFSPVSPTAKVIYAVLQRHADRNGVCFPSRRKMAELVCVSIKTVDRAIEELESIGAIEKRRRYGEDGSYRSNEYQVITAPPNGVPVDVDLSDDEPPLGTLVSLPRDIDDASPRDKNDTLTIAITNESQGTINISSSSNDDGQFEAFWQIYPRKVGKQAALKAWVKARKTASAQQILEGARTYARQRDGEDPMYTAHPSSWLNAGRWDDEPDPEYLTKDEMQAKMLKDALERMGRKELGA